MDASQNTEYWYRYVDTVAPNESGEYSLTVKAHQFKVASKTPKGVLLKVGNEKKFVSYAQNKKFAHPTLELAYNAFIARKQSQIKILNHQIQRATAAKNKMLRFEITPGVVTG